MVRHYGNISVQVTRDYFRYAFTLFLRFKLHRGLINARTSASTSSFPHARHEQLYSKQMPQLLIMSHINNLLKQATKPAFN